VAFKNSGGLPETDAPRLHATIKPHGTETGESSTGQRLFLSYLPIIDSVTVKLSRTHHLRDIESQEFSSFVRLALLDRDAEVLRQYSGTGTATAFLRVVIGRLLYDFRCELWGRWRPSAAARRQGPLGVLLERLLNRDGLSLDEAVETARTNHGVPLSCSDLRKLCERLSPRPAKYRPVSEDEALDVASPDPTPDLVLVGRQQTTDKARIVEALARARSSLSPQEQLILKMRIDDGLPVSRVAVALQLDQKRLYTTLSRVFNQLRETLRAEGISSKDANECLGHPE
jgi:DNA-directed RNA polymerase specialized sigma24 family protein